MQRPTRCFYGYLWLAICRIILASKLSSADLALQNADAIAAAEYDRLAVWAHFPLFRAGRRLYRSCRIKFAAKPSSADLALQNNIGAVLAAAARLAMWLHSPLFSGLGAASTAAVLVLSLIHI